MNPRGSYSMLEKALETPSTFSCMQTAEELELALRGWSGAEQACRLRGARHAKGNPACGGCLVPCTGFSPGRGGRTGARAPGVGREPDWDEPADLRPSKGSSEEDASANRFRVSLPVGLLAMLLFFLMWKFLQSQE